MDQRIVPLIMCGGAGTRLWPASREVRPKQFLPLFGKCSTFQDTMLRVSDEGLFERPIVITNAAYRFMVLEQLAEIGLEADILLEPVRRDSGPAIAAGAVFAEARDGNAIVLALAADHVVQNTAAFISACRQGLVAASGGHIVTFGVQPERPATEYGYISPGKTIAGEVRAVEKFVEKPDPATAAGYIDAGYLWNSGNFMFRASVLLDEYRKVDAESVAAVSDAVSKAGRDLGFVTLDPQAFEKALAISIDYAVMEKTARASVVPVSCGWSDVGSWPAVWGLSANDRQGAGAGGRRGRSRRGRDRGCGAGIQAKGCQRLEAAGRQGEDSGARGDAESPEGASALGFLSVGRQWRPPSGQAHHGEGRRAAVAAEAPPPLRALDRGARNRQGHRQRPGQDGA